MADGTLAMAEAESAGASAPSMTQADRIRLIACDVDGTLVVGGRVVSPELRSIFGLLAERGVAAALCTGRLPHWTEPVADELGVADYLICTEGGHVLHRPTRRRLHYATLDAEVVHDVARLVDDRPGLAVAALGDDRIRASSEEAARRAHWWGHRRELVHDIREGDEPVLLVVFGPPALVREVHHTAAERFDPRCTTVHDVEEQEEYGQVKIGAAEADKGVGAERLVRHLGGELCHVLAFGDYLNDLPIMARAGYSICPVDAHPAVQAAATRVSPYSAEEGFVARELRRTFGLG